MNLHKVYLAAIATIIVGAIALGWLVVQHTAENAAAAAQVKLLEQKNSELGKQNSELAKSIDQLRSETASQIASLERQRVHIVTPAQALPVIHDNTPLANATVQSLPNAPSVISQADSLKLADFALTCKECGVKLDSLQREDAKKDQIHENTVAELANMTSERDTWKRTAKGGSFWHRTLKALRVIGCAAAGGAGGSAAAGIKGAAIGSAAGAAVCSLL